MGHVHAIDCNKLTQRRENRAHTYAAWRPMHANVVLRKGGGATQQPRRPSPRIAPSCGWCFALTLTFIGGTVLTELEAALVFVVSTNSRVAICTKTNKWVPTHTGQSAARFIPAFHVHAGGLVLARATGHNPNWYGRDAACARCKQD